jgi:hypothetical protein
MANLNSGMERTGRRQFLSRCSATVASGLLLREAAALAGSSTGSMPTMALGPHRVTRLIVGANPITGYSYLGPEVDQEMKAYFTPQRTLDFLRQCEQEGINTHQFSASTKAIDVYRALRDQGSKLQLIGLYSKREDIKPVVQTVAPLGLVHHGGATDRLFREGRSSEVHDFVKAVHDQGVLAGVSAHNPDCIQRVADEGWDVDFFMTCFYYMTRDKKAAAPPNAGPVLEGPDVGYKFYANDPRVMCKVIRQVKQPCLAFKILGAGRRCANQHMVREAFPFAFQQIKATDGVIVGMYPRHFNQVGANTQYARQLALPVRGSQA